MIFYFFNGIAAFTHFSFPLYRKSLALYGVKDDSFLLYSWSKSKAINRNDVLVVATTKIWGYKTR
jgi:hypothetical protein